LIDGHTDLVMAVGVQKSGWMVWFGGCFRTVFRQPERYASSSHAFAGNVCAR